MTPISPAMWQRMPWHAKARACAALDREARALAAELERMHAESERLAAEVQRARRDSARTPGTPTYSQELARAILWNLPADTDAPSHVDELLDALSPKAVA